VNEYVFDASVIGKWMLPTEREELHLEAQVWAERYERGELSIIVPDLLWIEVASLLWKAVRNSRITKDEATMAIVELRERELTTIESTPGLLDAALDIALSYNTSVYDSIYVALAKKTNTLLITADRKLANTLAGSYPVRWLGAI
jgi:predicted nucleic acid-binding protein